MPAPGWLSPCSPPPHRDPLLHICLQGLKTFFPKHEARWFWSRVYWILDVIPWLGGEQEVWAGGPGLCGWGGARNL